MGESLSHLHDAFISYSHAADGRLAPALQRGLEQLAKPWYRMRALRVFRDETNLSASPQLWQSIDDELAQSRWFLLFASVEAARSKWVAREVQWWLAKRGPERLLVLLTSGELAWDEAAGDLDWSRTTALARASRDTQALALTAHAASAVMPTSVARAASSLKLWAWGNTKGEVELRRTDDGPADGWPLVVEGGRALRNLVLSADASMLAMSGAQAGIQLWDLRERRPIDEPLRKARASGGIAFARDGCFLVTRYSDGELEWWSTDGTRWARPLCGIVNRRFTEREWATYVGGPRRGDAACEGPQH
jgi:hypothetical protein